MDKCASVADLHMPSVAVKRNRLLLPPPLLPHPLLTFNSITLLISINTTSCCCITYQRPYPMMTGWHNYHHTFPWDYATSEFGYKLNLSKVFIDAMAWLGQAYDLKQAGTDVVMERRKRTGDLKACVQDEVPGRESPKDDERQQLQDGHDDDEEDADETVPSTSL